MMQANWSLILNVLLLIGVIVAINRLMKARRDSLSQESYSPSLGQEERAIPDPALFNDDIIAVRKVDSRPQEEERPKPKVEAFSESKAEVQPKETASLMMFLVAKENRKFAGYELLQTVLASGLRFGEGHLFYRHQFANGQGPVLCGLAAATPTGVFDMQNIGGFSVRGLCLFMHASKNPSIDSERFSIMLETARQLSEGLDAHLLDDQRRPLSEESLVRYCRILHIEMPEVELSAP